MQLCIPQRQCKLMTLIDKAEVLMLENEFSKIYIRVYQGEQIIRTDRAVELN